jgi:hypothetical protein
MKKKVFGVFLVCFIFMIGIVSANPACSDGVDNGDGDSLIDYCDGTNAGTCDPECSDIFDNSETSDETRCSGVIGPVRDIGNPTAPMKLEVICDGDMENIHWESLRNAGSIYSCQSLNSCNFPATYSPIVGWGGQWTVLVQGNPGPYRLSQAGSAPNAGDSTGTVHRNKIYSYNPATDPQSQLYLFPNKIEGSMTGYDFPAPSGGAQGMRLVYFEGTDGILDGRIATVQLANPASDGSGGNPGWHTFSDAIDLPSSGIIKFGYEQVYSHGYYRQYIGADNFNVTLLWTDRDSDGVLDNFEVNGDTDEDGTNDIDDSDDDGDGIDTINEHPDPDSNFLVDDAWDSDSDTIPDYLDSVENTPPCPDNQTIMKLSGDTNAFGAMWNFSGTTIMNPSDIWTFNAKSAYWHDYYGGGYFPLDVALPNGLVPVLIDDNLNGGETITVEEITGQFYDPFFANGYVPCDTVPSFAEALFPALIFTDGVQTVLNSVSFDELKYFESGVSAPIGAKKLYAGITFIENYTRFVPGLEGSCSFKIKKNGVPILTGPSTPQTFVYDQRICYDQIFGSNYNSPGPHLCTGTNKVLGLEMNNNSKAEVPVLDNYNYDVCYGGLYCRNTTGTCDSGSGERVVAKLATEIRSNISNASDSSFPVKMCCGPTLHVVPDLTGAVWQNLLGEVIPATTPVRMGGRVVLNVTGSDLQGLDINYSIMKVGAFWWFWDLEVAQVSGSSGFTTWIAGQKLIDNTVLEDGTYYFEAKIEGTSNTLTSPNLIVEEMDPVPPSVTILSPEDRSVYFLEETLDFNADISHPDSHFEYEWTLGDGTILTGNSTNWGNKTFQYGYMGEAGKGQKNIALRAWLVDDPNMKNTDRVTIVIVNSTYPLAYVDYPKDGLVYGRRISLNASGTFAVESTLDATNPASCVVSISCAGGNCPTNTKGCPNASALGCTGLAGFPCVPSPAGTGLSITGAPTSYADVDYSAINFSWSFYDAVGTFEDGFSAFDKAGTFHDHTFSRIGTHGVSLNAII